MNRKLALALIIAGLIVLAGLILLLTGTLHIWEDGSWAIGNWPYPVTGCPAGEYCSTSPGFAVCAEFANSVHPNGDLFLLSHGVNVADCAGLVEFGE